MIWKFFLSIRTLSPTSNGFCQPSVPIFLPISWNQLRLNGQIDWRLYFVAMVMIRQLSSPPLPCVYRLTDLQKIFQRTAKGDLPVDPVDPNGSNTTFLARKEKKLIETSSKQKKLRVETTGLEVSMVLAQKNDPLFLWIFRSFFWGGWPWRMCSFPFKKKKQIMSLIPPRPQCMLALAWKRHWTRSQSDPQAVELQGKTT